jgi:hypothetical protein
VQTIEKTIAIDYSDTDGKCPHCGAFLQKLTPHWDASHEDVLGWDVKCPNPKCGAKGVMAND